MAELSHFGSAGPAIAPSIIQLRQAVVLSLAHHMVRDFSGESPPRMGMTKV